MNISRINLVPHSLQSRVRHRFLVDYGDRGLLAPADARRRDDADIATEQSRKLAEQLLRPGHLATQPVAHPYSQLRGRGYTPAGAFLHHIEVMVESRNFVDLGLCESQESSHSGEMRRTQLLVAIVDAVQILDQQVMTVRAGAYQGFHFLDRLGIHRAPFGRLSLPLFRRARRGNGNNRLAHSLNSDNVL